MMDFLIFLAVGQAFVALLVGALVALGHNIYPEQGDREVAWVVLALLVTAPIAFIVIPSVLAVGACYTGYHYFRLLAGK